MLGNSVLWALPGDGAAFPVHGLHTETVTAPWEEDASRDVWGQMVVARTLSSDASATSGNSAFSRKNFSLNSDCSAAAFDAVADLRVVAARELGRGMVLSSQWRELLSGAIAADLTAATLSEEKILAGTLVPDKVARDNDHTSGDLPLGGLPSAVPGDALCYGTFGPGLSFGSFGSAVSCGARKHGPVNGVQCCGITSVGSGAVVNYYRLFFYQWEDSPWKGEVRACGFLPPELSPSISSFKFSFLTLHFNCFTLHSFKTCVYRVSAYFHAPLLWGRDFIYPLHSAGTCSVLYPVSSGAVS